MNSLIINNDNNVICRENALQNYEYEANRLTTINNNMYHQVSLYDINIRNLENSNVRYWDAQTNFNQIMNNEKIKYDYFKNREQEILRGINYHTQLYRLFRFKDKLYYRRNIGDEFEVYDEKELEIELSSKYCNINIKLVNDLNDVIYSKKNKFRIDTTYISINSIPVLDNEDFNINIPFEIYTNHLGCLVKNHFSYNQYLSERLINYILSENSSTEARLFIENMTTVKDMKFLASRLGKFFKHLNTSNAIVLIGNKEVSEDILVTKIVKPIFSSKFYIKITDEVLKTVSIEEILKYKLIYHIDSIPTDLHLKEKLRDILIAILVNKSIETKDGIIPIHGQIIVTLDTEDIFLRDYLSLTDIFFVDSLENIMKYNNADDKILFYKNLCDSLDIFAKELSAIGNLDCKTFNQNDEFIKLLDSMDENIENLIKDNILDPFSDNFANLIPVVERYKHTYITGMTGSGKSELLKVLIMGDILRENGSIILLEPHGDLAQSVTKLVKDKSRLVYINPFLDDEKTPTINLFHLPNKSEQNIAKITQVILSVLKSINSDENFTGAMEDVLEMCIKVLLRRGNGSFKELYRFFNDNRNKDLVELGLYSSNQLEVEFFEDDFLNSKPTKDAVRRRLKKLLNDPVFSNLMNGENTINLEELMNEKGKVIVFNIPKGKMPNTYKYYIRFIVEYIQVLALKRADVAEEDRTDTHLYIDEAHNFITSTATISEILTESRKYKLFVTFAHQAITQIRDNNLRDIMTTMTNVKIIGKNSNKTLEVMNKTLNTKLEDVEKLKSGEFYISAGNNDIIKVNVTDKLLDGKENISFFEEEEQNIYQLVKYYRDIEVIDDSLAPSEQLKQKLDDFINAIKSIDIEYFNKIQDVPKIYEEFIYNLNDETDNASGYISKQDLSLYFNLIYPETPFEDNKLLLKLLKTRDDFFKQNVNSNKTYNSKKRYLIS
ncbi:type IV secretion system DNA-binding domain-containing protein [Aliarcobacter butzleri]|uniref:type IV secretory system conjugative DNA transfer family protein n=1 Tax=Aliarcobacter butzleri TaxID=28197 RepID=UPI0021B6CF6B|nr:type IV secretion system DNA-binding domain-containing protein [Aliarcobacter butzleri]MCT7566849.1 type IV secretion system DNA-binding domain-containing protein [Aliarcobacter butzleri]